MRHIILDDSVEYDYREKSYYIRFPDGSKSSPIRVEDGLEVDRKTKLLDPKKFKVIRTRKGTKVIKREDTTTRCFVFLSFKGSPYEQLEVDEEITTSEILEVYDIELSKNRNELKVVASISPRKVLCVNFYDTILNEYTKREFVTYDYISNEVSRVTLQEDKFQEIETEVVIQRAYERYVPPPKPSREYIDNLTEEEIEKYNEYVKKYWSRFPK